MYQFLKMSAGILLAGWLVSGCQVEEPPIELWEPDTSDFGTDTWDTDYNTDNIDRDSASESDNDSDTDTQSQWVVIPAGDFWMGTPGGTCPADYPGDNCEVEMGGGGGLRHVVLTHSFEMLSTEVTQYDYATKMGYNPSVFNPGKDQGKYCTVNCPVENVTWFAALTYANKMSIDAGYPPCYTLSEAACVSLFYVDTDYMTCMDDTHLGVWHAVIDLNADSSYECTGYRLPTAAEWEYAARAGSLTPFYPSESEDGSISSLEEDPNLNYIAWYDLGGLETTHPATLKEPNDWGLYDMSGNVSEWVWDWSGSSGQEIDPDNHFTGTATMGRRIVRGGSYLSHPDECRSGYSYIENPMTYEKRIGFRIVRTLP